MIQGYLDESGIQEGAPVCVVGGFFGGPGQFKRFGKAWQDTLNKYKISEFHAKEFWAFTANAERAGQYGSWSDNRARSFIRELTEVIYEFGRKIHPIATVLVVDSFNRLTYNQRRYLTGGALRKGKFVTSGCPSKTYFLPFQSVIIGIADHAPVGGKAHFAFDFNKNFKGYALDLYALMKQSGITVRDRLGEIAFPTGQEAVQLQAADLLCYLCYQYGQQRIINRSERPNEILKRIITGTILDKDFLFLDDAGLARLLADVGLPPDGV
jgi:hypothetical protein